MNHLFTLRSLIICFLLLGCQLALKAQTNPDPKPDTSFAIKSDTSLAVKAGSRMVIKSDTTLVINADTAALRKAINSLAKKADALRDTDKAAKTILIAKTPDSSSANKNITPVATAPSSTAPTVSTPIVNTIAANTTPASTAPASTPVDNTPTVTTPAVTKPDSGAAKTVTTPASGSTVQLKTIAPPVDGVIEVKNSNGGMQAVNTNSLPATIPANSSNITTVPANGAATPVSKPDSAGLAKNNNSKPAVTDPNAALAKDADTKAKDNNADVSNTDPTAVKNKKDDSTPAATDDAAAKKAADGTSVAGTDPAAVKKDSTATKTDTALAKKDTSLVRKADTTIVQKDTTAVPTEIKAQNGFLEFGGPGLAISANYDARFKKERNGWGYRVGVGFFTSGGNTVETVPFQINYLIGEHSHMLELGAGTTFLNSKGTNVGNSKFEFDKVTGFIATGSIGYRFQPAHKGINIRIAFTPILDDDGLIPAGGISVGYTFK